MLLKAYYAQYYAGIICQGLHTKQGAKKKKKKKGRERKSGGKMRQKLDRRYNYKQQLTQQVRHNRKWHGSHV